MSKRFKIIWSDYMKYRAKMRGFSLVEIEAILRFSSERYFDTASGRYIAIGKHHDKLIMIAYEIIEPAIIPITVHVTTRQQIKFRLKTGRFIHVR